jgi:hypothetical protein
MESRCTHLSAEDLTDNAIDYPYRLVITTDLLLAKGMYT